MASSAGCLVANSRSTETELVGWMGERVADRIGSGEKALYGCRGVSTGYRMSDAKTGI